MVNDRKVAVVGCGFVGSSSAFALMQSGLFSEMVLIDVDRARAEGEALDISHGAPFAHPMRIYAGDYEDAADAAIIVVTAGAAQKPGETRLDLVNKNVAIYRSIIPRIREVGFEGILLVVSNPVDVLTYAAIKMSGLPESRVIGSGTVLDTARLQEALGDHLGVDPRDVEAYIIGEHGDSELAVWSSADVAGVPLKDFCEMRGHFDHEATEARIADEVRHAAYEIIARKHATYYGIAMSVQRLCRAIMGDEKCILPVSSLMVGEYGLSDIAISMPTIIGRGGIECRVPISLDDEELGELHRSAAALSEVIDRAQLR
ncbi:L-lactate dehydrogenase [Collinsella tanakaei]|uniref:L-lactate dehydrogenase n=1 Tax=Collinsella tanakaei TaxID=626935 RepID=UPI0025A3A5CD|nr:L-lactate dehydrogenase [Collinsella tanakaei]MDM8299869.1 L-lactate dehydrogenase [Collinsella tanakaei]